MNQSFRSCPDCGDDRRFEQYHGIPGSCPDSPGGECPEWACAECGAALLGGVPAAARVPAGDIHSKVA